MARPRLIPDTTLLQAILDAFQTGGEKAVSFRLIAARNGLSAAALVGRFGNGEAMLRAALSHGWDQLLAEVDLIPTASRKSEAGRSGGTLSMLKGLGHPHPAVGDRARGAGRHVVPVR